MSDAIGEKFIPLTYEDIRMAISNKPKRAKKVKSPKPVTVMVQVRADEPAVAQALDILSAKFGSEIFRLAALRYFKNRMARAARQREIARLEAEVARLSAAK